MGSDAKLPAPLFDEAPLEPAPATRDTATQEELRELLRRGEYDPATAPWPEGF